MKLAFSVVANADVLGSPTFGVEMLDNWRANVEVSGSKGEARMEDRRAPNERRMVTTMVEIAGTCPVKVESED